MTKFELTQRLIAATKENVALSARCSLLEVQLLAERGKSVGKPLLNTIKAALAAAKAKAIRTNKCVVVKH